MNSQELSQQAVTMTELTLHLFHNCREREAHYAHKFGVSIAEFRCLRILNHSDNLTAKELANKMGLTSSRLTRITDGMVEKNLIDREMDHDDRRAIKIVLSPTGRTLAKNINDAFVAMHAQILSQIDPKKRQSVLNAMRRLLTSMEEFDRVLKSESLL